MAFFFDYWQMMRVASVLTWEIVPQHAQGANSNVSNVMRALEEPKFNFAFSFPSPDPVPQGARS